MTDKEKIKAEIERLREASLASESYHDALDDLLVFINSLPEEPVSEDLEKFAEEWDESLYRSDAVIAGANWQKQQMTKDALDGEVTHGKNLIIPSLGYYLDKNSIDYRDKVKVIIIKED